MPLYSYECLNGHSRDVYAHSLIQRSCKTVLCRECPATMAPVFSPGTPLTYFAEGGGGKWIHNLGAEPVLVTSHAHHERLMKEAKVAWAPARRGMPGCWGG